MDRLRRYWPYQVIVLLFVVVAYLFTPEVFQKKIVDQPDIASWKGMANEIVTYNQENPTGDKALWTNSMFSGMPATAISVNYEGDVTNYLYKAIHSIAGVRPSSYLLISLLGGFMLFLAFGVNIWLAALGAFAITFCSYNLQIIQVGHNSKMVAIAFMPWVLAAVVYSYRTPKKIWAILGTILFGLALSFQIKANHPQITYYLAIMVLGYAVLQFIRAIKEGYLKRFISISLLLLVTGLLGIASNINHLWPTYEYTRYTMRGGSELESEEGREQKGLGIEYATTWSYSIQELPNLMIPNFNGGSSSGELSISSETAKALKQGGYSGVKQIIKTLPLYWGPQPFTAGPMYMGAIMVFLSLFAFIAYRGGERWWILGVALIALLLSLGSNLLFLTRFLFNYLPLYNKFRTVSMILVLLQLAIPILAVLGLNYVVKLRGNGSGRVESTEYKRLQRALFIAYTVTAGFSLLMLLVPSIAGAFVGGQDGYLPAAIAKSLAHDRVSLLRADALRSLLFISVTFILLLLYLRFPIKRIFFLIAIISFVFADMWYISKRYLNSSHFVTEENFDKQYSLRVADRFILQDTLQNYRVLDLSVNTFNDSHVSYHHKSIGGYSPAKLQIYQDVIEHHLVREMQQIATDLNSSENATEAQRDFGLYPVLNMLNTKYVVVDGDDIPIVNGSAQGNCWIVNEIEQVSSLKEELAKISSLPFQLADSSSLGSCRAVVNSSFTGAIEGASIDSISVDERVQLTRYSPNALEYSFSSQLDRVVVFSEIYYPAGWKAYIDGVPTDIIRANYLLRAIKVPAGEHSIKLVFKPESIAKSAHYSAIASSALLLLLLFTLIYKVVFLLLKRG